MSSEKQIKCVYKIYFTNCKKVYIGSSMRWPLRKDEHLRTLNKNTHANIYLQRKFNKNNSQIKFKVLEEVELEEDLLKREQYWIDFFDSCNPSKGFNLVKMAVKGTTGYKYTEKQRARLREIMKNRLSEEGSREKLSEMITRTRQKNPSAYQNGKYFSAKTFVLQAPDGEVIEVTNLCKFCRENNLPYRKIIDVAREASIEWNGWTLPNRVHRKKKHYTFINPEGEIVKVFGLRSFCIENNLCKSTMRHISNGVGQTHKGWRAYFEDGPKIRKGKDYELLNKEGEIIKINNLKEFCKKNKCYVRSLKRGWWSNGFKLKLD